MFHALYPCPKTNLTASNNTCYTGYQRVIYCSVCLHVVRPLSSLKYENNIIIVLSCNMLVYWEQPFGGPPTHPGYEGFDT